MKNILVIYYSQTGQLQKIIDSIISAFEDEYFNIDYIKLDSKFTYAFPWFLNDFFRVFPESALQIPASNFELESSDKYNKNYDLVILGYQPWFLSPSIPMSTFLQSDFAKKILDKKSVITVIGCRNMWTQAQEDIKKQLKSINSTLVGNIVLYDRALNFISLVTILRWMLYGNKGGSGISEKDINHARIYGDYIKNCLISNKEIEQKKLLNLGAVTVIPHLCFMEKRAKVIFVKFARFIYNEQREKVRNYKIKAFQIYLILAILLLSPISLCVSLLMRVFFNKKYLRDIEYYRG